MANLRAKHQIILCSCTIGHILYGEVEKVKQVPRAIDHKKCQMLCTHTHIG